MAYDEKSKAYTLEYKKQYIKRVPLDIQYDLYGKMYVHARERGESVNGFIKRAIQETMERDHNPVASSDEKNSRFREKLRALNNEQEAVK